MGAVWRVQHVESLQALALKTIDPGLAANPRRSIRFLREARAAGALRSRHVTRIVDAQMGYVHDGVPLPFLVMELLEGRTLQELLDQVDAAGCAPVSSRGSRASSGARWTARARSAASFIATSSRATSSSRATTKTTASRS